MLIKKIRSFFRQPELPLLLFFFSLFLFVVPFQRPTEKGSIEGTFFSLFLAWGIVIILLYFMAREIPAPPDTKQDKP